MEFKYKQTYVIYSDTYEHAVYLACGGGPILVGTSCNHTFEHAFGVWWGPCFSGNIMQSYIRTCTIYCVAGPSF